MHIVLRPTARRAEDRPRRLHQKPSHPGVARLRDRSAALLLPGAQLAGHEPQIPGDLPGVREAVRMVDGRDVGDRRHGPDRRDGAEPPDGGVGRRARRQALVRRGDLLVELRHQVDERRDDLSEPGGERDRGQAPAKACGTATPDPQPFLAEDRPDDVDLAHPCPHDGVPHRQLHPSRTIRGAVTPGW